jgi:general secretion pathway protein J
MHIPTAMTPPKTHGASQAHGRPRVACQARLPRAKALRGFTLVELLVAIAIMALMAFMSWRALAGMSQAEAITHSRADDLLAVQAGMGQWTADLDALLETGEVPALDFDGRTLRLTRRDALESDSNSPGTQVVAWSLQQGQWRRWHVAGLRSRQALALAWEQAARWGQRPVADDQRQQVDLARADGWQVFYYRGDAWTNPLSADAVGTSTNQAGSAVGAGVAPQLGAGALPGARQAVALPDGVRLLLTLSPGQTLSGDLVLDWARPVLGGGKS